MSKRVQNDVTRESLCYTCRYSHVVRGFAESDELVYCDFGYPTRLVPFPVRECTSYGNRNVSELKDMQEIALTVRSAQPAGFVGFAPPKPDGTDDGEK